MHAEATEGSTGVIALRLDQIDPERIIPRKAWIDFRNRYLYNESFVQLLRAVVTRLEAAKPNESPYFDDLRTHQLWTPWRAATWARCRKQYWYEFVLQEQKFSIEPSDAIVLHRLRASRSIAAVVGYETRKAMREHLRGRGVSPPAFAKKLKKGLEREQKHSPSGLIETHNGTPDISKRIERAMDTAVNRYERWIDGLATPWRLWRLFPDAPKYSYTQRDWRIQIKYVPFAARAYGREVLFIENALNQQAAKQSERRFLTYVLAWTRNNRTEAENYKGQVLFLDTGDTTELIANEEKVTRYESTLQAAAAKFHRSRRIHPVIAQPHPPVCQRCKYLSVCHEGRKTVEATFKASVIPPAYDQAQVTLPQESILPVQQTRRRAILPSLARQLDLDLD